MKWILATLAAGGILYLIYDKQTEKAAKSAASNSASFTGGYAALNGSPDSAALVANKLNSLNCIELAALYNNLKEQYISGNNKPEYMAAMTTVMTHMLTKGCAIDKSGN